MHTDVRSVGVTNITSAGTSGQPGITLTGAINELADRVQVLEKYVATLESNLDTVLCVRPPSAVDAVKQSYEDEPELVRLVFTVGDELHLLGQRVMDITERLRL